MTLRKRRKRPGLASSRSLDRGLEKKTDREIRAQSVRRGQADPQDKSRTADRKRPFCGLCKKIRVYRNARHEILKSPYLVLCSPCWISKGKPDEEESKRIVEAADARKAEIHGTGDPGPWGPAIT